MAGPRFRLPSPAFVIATVALFAALGGTSFAATKVIASTHKDKKADTKLVKKLAPTLNVKHAKTADIATAAANATHATTADSATNATNAGNAANAANAANASKLGNVAASGYVQNSGAIFVSTGSSNWTALNSTDPISWTFTTNATWASSSGAGSFFLTAHPSIPTALYGKNLELKGATLCYSASASAEITRVEVVQSRYSTSGIGAANVVVNDGTTRTDDACRTYPLSTPVTLSSLDDVSLVLSVTYTAADTLFLGQSGLTLAPTTTVASAPKPASGRLAPATTRGVVTR